MVSYTMNLAQATRLVLEELGLAPSEESPIQRPLPWRMSLGLGRRTEDVRPVFWRNRNSSYVARTQTWDEYPNGRWTDSRSPAFGELDAYGVGLKGTNEQNIKLWGEPKSVKDLSGILIRFLEGKLDRLPWSDSPLTAEAAAINDKLIDLNQRGFLTINSQPAVNGVKSSHPVFGWGPKNGFVYQKAYLELLVPSYLIDELIARIEKNEDLTYHATNKDGELKTNTADSPNALTWGIFAGREIIQPTIVETISFLAWKDEAFRLGEDWAKCHDASSPSRKLIQQVMDDWYLVNIGTSQHLSSMQPLLTFLQSTMTSTGQTPFSSSLRIWKSRTSTSRFLESRDPTAPQGRMVPLNKMGSPKTELVSHSHSTRD